MIKGRRGSDLKFSIKFAMNFQQINYSKSVFFKYLFCTYCAQAYIIFIYLYFSINTRSVNMALTFSG